jgi:DNA-binding NtrC family response regulator
MKSKIRILVVDDEPPIVAVLSRYLERCGYTVISAGNVQDAIEIASKENPEIIISDITFPELDGYFLLKQIKKSQPEIAVIMMTGHTEHHTVKEALRLGADEYISKPLDFEELSTILDKIAWTYMPRWQEKPETPVA